MKASIALRDARKQASLTQAQLAVAAGVQQPAISRIENGTVVPSVETLDRLLQECGVSLEVMPRLGIGVDRTLIHEMLSLSPADRLYRAVRDGNNFGRFLRSVKVVPLDADILLGKLVEHGVRFILIGGLAASIHGSPSVTRDMDICYARDLPNLERLATSLRELRAKLRGAPDDVVFLLDARTLRAGDSFTFVTDGGPLDCLGTPAGTNRFEDLDSRASTLRVGGKDIRVVSLDDLIRMKRAAGSPKDRIELEILGALREEIEKRS